jgi:hypothetical protein
VPNLRDPERLSVDIGGNRSTSIAPARMQFSRVGARSIQSQALALHAWGNRNECFLEMLKPPLVGKVNSEECTLCHRILEEEVTRLRELAQKLQGTMFAQWMKSQGTLCLEHGRKVKEFVPLRLRTLVDEIVERSRAELEQELETFLEQLKHGIHEGGGLLGRAAEFLVGQRGL